MCIIAVKPASRPLFDEETVRRMFLMNPDGAGLMYLKPDGKVHIEKGFLEVESLLSYIGKNREKLEHTDLVMHFRIATSGKKDALGCHPYPVWTVNRSLSCDVSLAMVHNGILDSYGFKGNKEVNDTQIFIKECLRRLPHNFLRNKAICDMLSRSLTYGYRNCLAFLEKDGIHLLGGEFIEDDGYFYSNDSYKPRDLFRGYSIQYKKEDIADKYPISSIDCSELLLKMGKTGFDDYLNHLFGKKEIIRADRTSCRFVRQGLQTFYRPLDDELPECYYDDVSMYTLYDGKIERHFLDDEENDSFYNEDTDSFSLGI